MTQHSQHKYDLSVSTVALPTIDWGLSPERHILRQSGNFAEDPKLPTASTVVLSELV